MKANFIIGKKQIILASLVVVLGAAVYLNWTFANDNQDITGETDTPVILETKNDVKNKDDETKKSDETDISDTANTSSENNGKNMGDSLLVDSIQIAADEYFAKVKLDKMKTRDIAIETINTILEDEKSSTKEKEKVSNTAIEISNTIEVESKLENLIKAKGISECVVYINSQNASVVVKSDGLTKELATQIKNIVLSEGNILGENIAITELR